MPGLCSPANTLDVEPDLSAERVFGPGNRSSRAKPSREIVILNGAEHAGMPFVLRPEHADLMLVHQEASTQEHAVSRMDRVFYIVAVGPLRQLAKDISQ
jgi:hypothetical protein